MEKLLEALAAVDSQIDSLLSNDELSAEQKAEHDQLVASREKTVSAIQKEKNKLERSAQRESLAAETAQITRAQERERPRVQATGPISDRQMPNLNDVPALREAAPRIPAEAKRFGSLKHFSGIHGGRAADERAYRFGMFGLAMLAQSIPGRYGMLPKFQKAQEFFGREFMPGIQATAHQSNDASGSQFLIPEEFSWDMINLKEQFGVARRVFRVRPMESDVMNIPRRTGGLTAYFPGEGGQITESSKSWDQVKLVAKDAAVIARYSAQVNADAAINFGDDLAGEIAYAFASTEDDCAFNGDGTSTYAGIRGVRNKLLNVGTGSLATQGSGNTWPNIVIGDFDATVGLLPQYADTPNACWLMHRTFYYSIVEKLVQASGGVPAYEVRQGNRAPRPLFKGYPVEFSQKFPSATATASVVATLGDYTMGASFGDRMQDSIMFSEHAYVNSQSVFERLQIAIRGWERFDIVVHDVGSSSAAGPIVGLRTGS